MRIHYHFGGKAGVLEAALLAGLQPLRELDRRVSTEVGRRPLEEVILELASGLEQFYSRVLPVFEAIQSDAGLRKAFRRRLATRDLGPHRAVRLVERHLQAARERGDLTGADVSSSPLLLVGACFLRAYQQRLLGPRGPRLPDLEPTVAALLRDVGR
jgi:AcrR family transcriptional regulator